MQQIVLPKVKGRKKEKNILRHNKSISESDVCYLCNVWFKKNYKKGSFAVSFIAGACCLYNTLFNSMDSSPPNSNHLPKVLTQHSAIFTAPPARTASVILEALTSH